MRVLTFSSILYALSFDTSTFCNIYLVSGLYYTSVIRTIIVAPRRFELQRVYCNYCSVLCALRVIALTDNLQPILHFRTYWTNLFTRTFQVSCIYLIHLFFKISAQYNGLFSQKQEFRNKRDRETRMDTN